MSRWHQSQSTLVRTHLVVAACAAVLASATSGRTQPAAAQTPQISSVPPPLPNRANDALPRWLRLRAELRERIEGVDGAGFTPGRDDLYWLTRLRVNASVVPSKSLSVHLQAQDARVARKEIGPGGTPFSAPFDLRLAYTDIGAASSRATLRVGRQELFFGEQRLVGHVSWLNAARTFDGARVTVRSKKVQVDAFATSLVRIMDGAFDRSGNGNWFGGAYITATGVIPKASLEPFVFSRGDRNVRPEIGSVGALNQVTVGLRWAGTLPSRFDYSTEMALQRGGLSSDAIAAWAGHWQIRRSWSRLGAIKVSSEYNVASGDRDPADGRRGTFDQLYPTPHDKYGLADQIGWRNMHHARLGAEFTALAKTQFTANYHSWWLKERRDGLYAASGALVTRVPTGAASRHIGHEVDIQLSRGLTRYVQLAGGLAHIIPGGYLRETTPGSRHTFPYLMATYVFLADR